MGWYTNNIYGFFLKWWYPQNTPKWSFLVGKPMVVGYHHFRKPPYTKVLLPTAPSIHPFLDGINRLHGIYVSLPNTSRGWMHRISTGGMALRTVETWLFFSKSVDGLIGWWMSCRFEGFLFLIYIYIYIICAWIKDTWKTTMIDTYIQHMYSTFYT